MNDEELLKQFHKGNKKVFDLLVELYKKRIYFFALKLTNCHQDAEDISQDVFIKAYKNFDNFHGKCRILSWLFTITVNHYISQKKRRHLKIVQNIDMENLPKVTKESSENIVMNKELQALIKKHIDKLPQKQRFVLILRTYEGLKYGEISTILGISKDSVRANLSYARENLRKSLGDLL